MVDPFTTEEIDEVVKHLPSDKSPRPDGFNTDFIKACWHIVKNDFMSYVLPFRGEKLLYKVSMAPT